MKKKFKTNIHCCVVLLALLSGCSKNYFEGKIVYTYQYVDKNGNDITDKMKIDQDLKQYYFINPLNYKSKNEKGQLTQLYNSTTNKYYYNVGLELEEVSGAKEFPKTFKATKLSEKLTLLDRPCQALLLTSEVGSTTYFYSKKVKVNPAPFSRHRFGNWNRYLSFSKGALPLKYVIAFGRYTLIATAVEVVPMHLDDQEFDVMKALEK